MMGRQRRDQGRLFYEFRLEDRIPENHLLRRINVFVTVALEGLHKELEPQQRQSRAVKEYLAALDENAQPNPDRKPPKVISPSDPSSAWTAKANKRVQFGYGLNYLIDIDTAVIVDVEATPARAYDEVAATKTMLDRTDICFGLKPKRLPPTALTGRASSSVGSSRRRR